MSNYLEEKVLRALIHNEAFPSIPSVYLGLAASTLFADADTDPYTNEPSGGSYARQALADAFTVAGPGGVWSGANTGDIVFPEATGTWGNIVGVGFFDAISAGNLLAHGALTEAREIDSGDEFKIDAGDLIVGASGAFSDYVEEKLLKALLSGAAFPSTIRTWVGLALGTVFTDSSYSTEATGAGYERHRQWGNNLDWIFNHLGVNYVATNTKVIGFPVATANYSAAIAGWGIFDAVTVGNLLMHGGCTPKSVSTGEAPSIPIYGLVVGTA